MSYFLLLRRLTAGRLLLASGLTRMLMALVILTVLWCAVVWSTSLP